MHLEINIREYKDRIRKAKEHLKLNLAMYMKNNKKGLYRYISQKKKIKDVLSQQMEQGI